MYRGKERIFWKASGNGRQSNFFPPLLNFFRSFLHSNSALFLKLHKWDLQNRLTPFISSASHYTCIVFQAVFFLFYFLLYIVLATLQINYKLALELPQISLIRVDEIDKLSRAKSKLHPLCIQSSICTQSTWCQPNTAEGDENSMPGMT